MCEEGNDKSMRRVGALHLIPFVPFVTTNLRMEKKPFCYQILVVSQLMLLPCLSLIGIHHNDVEFGMLLGDLALAVRWIRSLGGYRKTPS